MTDNYFIGCPPKMGGFREMTSYYPNTVLNEQIRFNNDIRRDDEYRYFLQQNAENLEKTEWDYLRSNYSCFPNECIFDNKRTLVHPKTFNDEIKKYDTLISHLPKEPINEFSYRFYNPQAFIYGEKTNLVPNPKTYQCKVYQDENLFNQ